MATTHHTTNYVQTDTRPSWPWAYCTIWGGVIFACAVFAFKGLAIIPLILLTLAVLILWGLRRYGTWKNKELLKHLPTWYAWKTAIVVFVVGIVGIILGTITGTWLADFFRSLLLFGTILILVISVMATAGLLLAVSYHARKMRVAAIVSLLIVSMFLPQFGAGVAQTPVEQTRQACEQAPGLFPADCP